MKILAKVLNSIDTLSEWMGKAFSFLIVAITIIEVREVVARYIFGKPTDWSWELSTILYGIFFVMGGAWVLKEQRHVRTDIFYARLSSKMKAYVDLFFFPLLFFSFVLFLTWYSTEAAVRSVAIRETTYTVWAPPYYPSKIALALGFVLLGLVGLAKWIRDLVFIVKGMTI